MVLSLIYGRKYKKAQVGSVELDVTLREDHNYNSRVTTYPIEDGSTLSDHIINEPINIVLEGMVSDTPINILSQFNRSVTAFNQLIELHEQREILTLVTGLKSYPNMAITSLNVPRTIRTGQSLNFRIELQEVQIDTTLEFIIDEQDIFGGVQSRIPQDIVMEANDIPLIQNDPENSLIDQASSGLDFGIQQLQPIPPNVLTNVNENIELIEGTV